MSSTEQKSRALEIDLHQQALKAGKAKNLAEQVNADMLGRMDISTWRTDAGDFDVLTDIPNAEGHRATFDDLVARAAIQEVNGVIVRVASLEDVIASKEWADRPKDHDALPELRRLRDVSNE